MSSSPRLRQSRLPRFDRSDIRETTADLQRLLRTVSGRPAEDRVRLLLLLRGDARLTVDAAAGQLGRSRRTTSRWLQLYREGGIDALLRQNAPGRPRRLADQHVRAISQRISERGIDTAASLRNWLREEFGIEYTERGARSVLRRDLPGIARGWIMLHGHEYTSASAASPGPGSGADFIALLNALPTTTRAVEWIPAFRDALLHILPDVDRISVNVDVNCNLADPGSYRRGAAITQHVEQSGTARRKVRISVASNGSNTPAVQLMRTAADSGFPVHLYHEPHCLDYFIDGEAYVGSLILWRGVDKPPISERTLSLVESLRAFLQFVLSDLVARHRSEQPVSAAINRALEGLADDAGLTEQEQRVVMLQFMGHSYKEMADTLGVTLDTIKKHLKQVHKKTGTRSQSELFARYFTYKID